MAWKDVIVINGKVLVSDSAVGGEWEVCIVGETTTTTTTTTTTSSSTTPTTTDYPPGAPELFFDALATEEELNLTYKEFVEKRVNDFYENNPTIFKDKTDKEKEDIILMLVGEGELFADIAIEIAIKEGLDIE